jgi:hypothetical protein
MNRKFSRIIQILAFIIIIAVSDKVIGIILNKLYFHQKSGPGSSLTYSLSECKADILIFGNSRAQHHYDPKIISDLTGLSCFNAGLDGGHSILLPYAQIKTITDRYTPKIIILEFFPSGLVHDPSNYEKLSILLPYYNRFPELKPYILLRGPYEKIKLLSSIYPFNSDIINILKFNTNYHYDKTKVPNGYVPLIGNLNVSLLKPSIAKDSHIEVDSNLVDALNKIIRICQKKNIKLFIINSPIFHTISDKPIAQSDAEKLAIQIIKQNHVDFLDYSWDSTFIGHNEWFSDRAHLNSDGSKIFSNKLIEHLKNIDNRTNVNLTKL